MRFLSGISKGANNLVLGRNLLDDSSSSDAEDPADYLADSRWILNPNDDIFDS